MKLCKALEERMLNKRVGAIVSGYRLWRWLFTIFALFRCVSFVFFDFFRHNLFARLPSGFGCSYVALQHLKKHLLRNFGCNRITPLRDKGVPHSDFTRNFWAWRHRCSVSTPCWSFVGRKEVNQVTRVVFNPNPQRTESDYFSVFIKKVVIFIGNESYSEWLSGNESWSTTFAQHR